MSIQANTFWGSKPRRERNAAERRAKRAEARVHTPGNVTLSLDTAIRVLDVAEMADEKCLEPVEKIAIADLRRRLRKKKAS